jgi:glycosyltransferase involved in cell wall biosynthesis
MKILHVIPSISIVRGGPSQAILETVSTLNNIGVKSEIATTNDDGNNLLDVPLSQKISYQNVPVWFFPRFSPQITAIREFAFSAGLTHWLWNNIDRYDLIHIHAIFSYSSTIAMLIARIKNVPYICRPLGQLCQWSLQQGFQKKQIYLNLIERANLNSSQALHFTAESEQQEATNLNLKCPSFILPHGITMPLKIPDAKCKLREQLNIAENEPIILFLSRLHPKKGLNYLIPALGKLHHRSFTFVLAGNGNSEYEIEVKQLLDRHNLSARTHRVGFARGEYKNLLLQGSDLFALTSYSENFGIAVLEALAAGIPALVTPGVALSSLLKQEQIGYVSDLNIDAISSSVEYCLNHLPELKQKGDRAYQLIQQSYTWDCIAKNLVEVYQNILQNKQYFLVST